MEIFWIVAIFLFFRYILSEKQDKQDQEENKKAAWQTLAAANDLNLVFTSSHHKGLHIKGIYRGYNLELFTDWISYGRSVELGTCLKLVVSPSTAKPTVFINKETKEPIIVVGGKEFSLKQAVNRLAPTLSDKYGPAKLLGYKEISYQKLGVVSDIQFLQSLFDRLSEAMDFYQGITDVGGEAIPFLESLAALKDSRVQTLHQLLEGIASKSSEQLSNYASSLFCPYCFLSFGPHRMTLLGRSFYGCRACGQSRTFFYCPEGIVAVLDTMWHEGYCQQGNSLRVNWLAYRVLFDFDRIEIIRATDEEVERFAVQVGNDTDELRKPRYQHMTCTIGPECLLSENTVRILENMFGQVKQATGVING